MKRFYGAKVISVFVLIMCLFVSLVAQAQEKAIKMRFSSWWAPAHKFAALEAEWIKEVEKRTGGKVKISYFPGNTLAPPPQAFDSLSKGLFDIATSPLSYTAGRFPLMEILDLPLQYKDGVQATGLANAFYRKFRPKELDGVHLLLIHCAGPSFIHTKKKISNLDDVKGLRIKSSGISSKIVEALGGVPVTMSITETYDALSKGLADGLLLNMEVLKTFKFGDLLKFTVQDHGMSNTTALWIAMNKKRWESLPKDVQQAIDKVTEEYIPKFAQAHIELDNEGEEYAVKSGIAITKVSKEVEAKTAAKMKPLFDEYVKNTNAKGLPGDEALKFCFDYLKTH